MLELSSKYYDTFSTIIMYILFGMMKQFLSGNTYKSPDLSGYARLLFSIYESIGRSIYSPINAVVMLVILLLYKMNVY